MHEGTWQKGDWIVASTGREGGGGDRPLAGVKWLSGVRGLPKNDSLWNSKFLSAGLRGCGGGEVDGGTGTMLHHVGRRT